MNVQNDPFSESIFKIHVIHVLLLILNENNVKWNHELHQICF